MDDTYFCPDCRAEHQEPLEATLGHLARCVDCVIVAASLEPLPPVTLEIVEIRAAA